LQLHVPISRRLYKRDGGGGFCDISSKFSQDDARATTKFAKAYGANFPILIDEEEGRRYAVSNGYGLTKLPTIVSIDTDGKVKLSSMGVRQEGLGENCGGTSETQKDFPHAVLVRRKYTGNKPG